jgi:catechol 2,3-dioxygenase-like lactoylglutathione lyase family enzyme
VAGLKAKAVGINHVALEVRDLEAALEFYGRIVELKLRGRAGRMAFVDMGDQFLAIGVDRTQAPDRHRHCLRGGPSPPRRQSHTRMTRMGRRVDRARGVAGAREAGAQVWGTSFLDPWGNHVQVVQYDEVQFTKAPEILRGMGLEGLGKTERALHELREKGLSN